MTVSNSTASQGEIAKIEDVDEYNSSNSQVTMHSQLDNMFGVTIMQFTRDNQFVITSSDKGLPTVWDVKTGFPTHHMERHCSTDEATPWFTLAVKDKFIIGTTTTSNDEQKEDYPQLYKLQIWTRNSGKPHRPCEDMEDLFVTKCLMLKDDERFLVPMIEHYNPGDKAEILLKIFDVERMEPLQMIRVYMAELPELLQITEDNSHIVMVSPAKAYDTTLKALTVYRLDIGEFPEAISYEFRKGSKFKKYGTTSNVILRNGISLAAGLNGDLQLWDLSTGDYEGNLYHDASVKEKANPGLHNHKGKRVNHMMLSEDGRYLLCGGGDGTTSLWDLDNEIMVHSYQGHKSEVTRVAITSDNQVVLTAGADSMLFVWPFSSDRPITRLYIHAYPTQLQISEDKQTVCVIGHRTNEPNRFMMFRLLNLPNL